MGKKQIKSPLERGLKLIAAMPATKREPITDKWLRSLGYDAFTQLSGSYSDTKTDLLLWKSKHSFNKTFWVLSFAALADGEWSVTLNCHKESQFLGLLRLANVQRREDVIRLLDVIQPPTEGASK